MSSPLHLPQNQHAKQDHSVYEDVDLDLLPNDPQKAGKTRPGVPDLLGSNDFRQLSVSPFSQDGRLTPQGSFRESSPGPGFHPPSRDKGFIGGIRSFFLSQWHHNGGPLLIVLAQFFAACMNLSTRLLELEDGLHPMQILCARMTATIFCCFGYMWYQHVPLAPWGPREIRPLLVLRAFAGFVGLYGMWCSIMYLPLAEATVISFLAPNGAGYLCRIFLKEPFTRREQWASYLALGGVILITRPIALFSSPPDAPAEDIDVIAIAAAALNNTAVAEAAAAGHKGLDYIPTIAERLSGIGMGLLGVIGAATTLTVLRAIGPRAHPLISVNYFSTFCTLVTVLTLSLAPLLDYNQPDLHFVLPTSFRQWGLLTVVGLCGFSTQFLLTSGLARERSNRATGMIYTHVLFAAGFDRFVFGHTMGWVSVAGCGMVVGSALWVAVSKRETSSSAKDRGGDDLEARGRVVGASGMAGGEDVPMLAIADRDEIESNDGVEMEGGLVPSAGDEAADIPDGITGPISIETR